MAKGACRLLGLVFPEDCRICGEALRDFGRVPVCRDCLRLPAPLDAAYFCVACRTPFLNAFPLDESGRCALCRNGLRGFDAAYSFGVYDGALRELIHLLKYHGIRTLAGPLASRLVSAVPLGERFDVIVPVPLHWRRRWRRGYNQSALLACELGRRMGLPVVEAVRRRRATAAQTGLTRSRRRANVAGAFAPAGKPPVEGRRLLLVDDVLTTGATAAACARSLKAAGAAYVAVLTLARADRRLAWDGGAGGRGTAGV